MYHLWNIAIIYMLRIIYICYNWSTLEKWIDILFKINYITKTIKWISQKSYWKRNVSWIYNTNFISNIILHFKSKKIWILNEKKNININIFQLIFKYKKKILLKIFAFKPPQWVEPTLTERGETILIQLNLNERNMLLDLITQSSCSVHSLLDFS